MDNSLLIATQTQRVLQRRLELAANNLANATTAGFKADAVMVREHTQAPAEARDEPNDIRFVRDVGIVRDMAQGGLRRTGATFDFGLEGEGFFAVQGADGQVLYTRDGAFKLGPDGQLMTRDGALVLGDGGPIAFDPQGEAPTLDADGTLLIAGAAIARFRIETFENPGALEKVGDNLYAAAGAAPRPATARVMQGALEESNVRPVIELTRVMEISRAYESAARIVRQNDDLRQRAIERLGRV